MLATLAWWNFLGSFMAVSNQYWEWKGLIERFFRTFPSSLQLCWIRFFCPFRKNRTTDCHERHEPSNPHFALCLTISQKSDRKSFFFPTWNHLFPKKRHKSQGGANYWEKIGWRLQVFFQVSRDTALAQLMNSFWASPFKFFIGFLGRRVSSLFCFSIHYWRKNPFRFA